MTSTTLHPPVQASAGDTRTARAPRADKRKKVLHFIAVHTVAIAVALLFILPFVFVFLTSVMSDGQAMSGDLWPSSWHW
ncbi:carbohydrate ABC transporter permease, partial [Streptomyces sp. SID11233]|nr:carbohydrate ABC transporter permease [Streptomyces sp. SID11233]